MALDGSSNSLAGIIDFKLGAPYEIVYLEDLEGDELLKFLNDNNIPVENTAVWKTEEVINGVIFPVYYVYDIKCSEKKKQDFRQFGKDSLSYVGSIDKKVLQYIRDGGTSIIFEQTINCDGGSKSKGSFNGAAYCNSRNRNVIIFNSTASWNYQYNAESIVHETGHAYDFTLRYNYDNALYAGISAITVPEANAGLFTRNATTNLPYSWQSLIDNDASNMLTAAGNDFSLYTLEDFKSSKTEYFAEVFKYYYLSPDRNQRLQFIAPDSYNAMENLINNTINGVN